MLRNRDIHLVCNGHYPEIHIIHPMSLEVVMTLSSRIQPDWISALCPLRPVKREGVCDHLLIIISSNYKASLHNDTVFLTWVFYYSSANLKCL